MNFIRNILWAGSKFQEVIIGRGFSREHPFMDEETSISCKGKPGCWRKGLVICRSVVVVMDYWSEFTGRSKDGEGALHLST